MAAALGLLGRVALAEGRVAEAARVLGESLALQRVSPDRTGVAGNLEALAEVAGAQGAAFSVEAAVADALAGPLGPDRADD